MSAGKSPSTYVIYFGTGDRSEEIDVASVRALIQDGKIGLEDHVSKDGGPPVEYFQYDEFVDLWDVDTSFSELYVAEPTYQGPASQVDEEPAVPDTGRAADDQPSPFLPSTATPPGIEEVDDLEALFLEPDVDRHDVTHKAPAPQAFTDEALDRIAPIKPGPTPSRPTAPGISSSMPEFGGADGVAKDTSAGFEGYDPLGDTVLDPLTIRDLLYDSSLFTVLTVGKTVDSEMLYEQYLSRMELLASRQRAIGRSDIEQSQALDDIRRLMFMSYEALRDETKREAYEDSSAGSGGYLPAGTYLEIDMRPSPEALIEESLSELAAEAALMTDEEGEPDSGVYEEIEADGDAQDGRAADVGRRMVDFSTPSASEEDVSGPQLKSEGPRIYESVDSTLEHIAIEDIGDVNEIFTDKPQTREWDALQKREKVSGARKRALSKSSKGLAALVVTEDYPEGLRWAEVDDPGLGLREALQLLVPAIVISLGVILFTDLGKTELDYANPSPWFFGRGLMLIGLAVIGTMAVRREPITRLGLFPDPVGILVGAVVGVIIGIAGAFVAPTYLPEGTSFVFPLLSVVFIAIAHEVFFRGYITRMMLISFPSTLGAIAVSCALYGVFYLTYTNVLQQQGFLLLYYSVFLFGFGTGGIYAAMYWRWRSIWPGAVAHILAVAFSMLVAI